MVHSGKICVVPSVGQAWAGVQGFRQTLAFREPASAGRMLGVLECFLENMNRGFCAEIWVSVWTGEGPMGGRVFM